MEKSSMIWLVDYLLNSAWQVPLVLLVALLAAKLVARPIPWLRCIGHGCPRWRWRRCCRRVVSTYGLALCGGMRLRSQEGGCRSQCCREQQWRLEICGYLRR